MFEAQRMNMHLDKLPKNRPDILVGQGKILWKCRVCFNYNPSTFYACEKCGFKNPMTLGVKDYDRKAF